MRFPSMLIFNQAPLTYWVHKAQVTDFPENAMKLLRAINMKIPPKVLEKETM